MQKCKENFMGKIAVISLGVADSSCSDCHESMEYIVRSSITQWQDVSDEDAAALTAHLSGMNTRSKRFMMVRQLSSDEIDVTLAQCLKFARKAEEAAAAAKRVAAARGEAYKKTDAARKVKQFEKLRASLQSSGVLSAAGEVIVKGKVSRGKK
jgi:hypothetical protein